MIQEEKEWRYVGMTFFISVALNGLASDSYTSLMYFVIPGTLKFRNVYFKTNGDKGQLCNTFNPHSLSNSGPSSPKSLQNSPFQTKNVIPGKDNDWRWANIKSTCAQITPSLSFFSIDHEILIISRSMNKTSSSSQYTVHKYNKSRGSLISSIATSEYQYDPILLGDQQQNISTTDGPVNKYPVEHIYHLLYSDDKSQ